MAKTGKEIYDAMVAHIASEKGAYNTWYVGITSDIESRLFGDHNVPKKGYWYMWLPATSVVAAKHAEEALLKLGLDGGTGSGDDICTRVYCYKKTSVTNP